MLRIISEIKPKFIVGENVFGLLNWNGGMVFAEVCSDLEHQGYEITPVVIPAAAVNAPHGRSRVWFVAYSNGTGEKHNGGTNIAEEREVRGNEKGNVLGELCGDGNAANTLHEGLQGRQNIDEWEKYNNEGRRNGFNIRTISKNNEWNAKQFFKNFPTQSPICSGDDGISNRLDGITFPKWRAESIKGYGNAIVPQVAFEIFKAIEKTYFDFQK
jgi:DNA (cytosine-5)-methyltransferase 1